jgi:hypothetical protein
MSKLPSNVMIECVLTIGGHAVMGNVFHIGLNFKQRVVDVKVVAINITCVKLTMNISNGHYPMENAVVLVNTAMLPLRIVVPQKSVTIFSNALFLREQIRTVLASHTGLVLITLKVFVLL